MDNDYPKEQRDVSFDTNSKVLASETIIPVVQESLIINKETIETARVHISKKVTAHLEKIDVPLTAEQYEIVHVPINQTVDTPPPAVRHEGDTTIFSIVKEVLVVQKRYEVVEELHITKRTTEHTETQNITLLTEEVSVTREPLQSKTNGI